MLGSASTLPLSRSTTPERSACRNSRNASPGCCCPRYRPPTSGFGSDGVSTFDRSDLRRVRTAHGIRRPGAELRVGARLEATGRGRRDGDARRQGDDGVLQIGRAELIGAVALREPDVDVIARGRIGAVGLRLDADARLEGDLIAAGRRRQRRRELLDVAGVLVRVDLQLHRSPRRSSWAAAGATSAALCRAFQSGEFGSATPLWSTGTPNSVSLDP